MGIVGPVLAVPALALVGVPMLLAVAVAQVQSIFRRDVDVRPTATYSCH